MKEYVLAITGIVIISLLINLIIPSGETRKYIKGIFGIITLCVIVSPITKIFSGEMDVFNVDFSGISFDDDSIKIEDYGAFYYDELKLQKYLSDNGVICDVSFVGKIKNVEEIDYINIILKNQSLSTDERNIFIAKVENLAVGYTGLNEDDVRVFYE